jgi:O-antigen/teichoic acid export membrane protein
MIQGIMAKRSRPSCFPHDSPVEEVSGRSAGSQPKVGPIRVLFSPLLRHWRDVALTIGNNVIARGLTFLAVALILRELPKDQAGGFSLMLKISGLSATLVTLGLQAAAVRQVSAALASGDEARANMILRFFLKFRLLQGALISALGFFLAPAIARSLLHQPDTTVYIRIAFFGAATNALFQFSLHHLQARQAFFRYAFLNVGVTAGRAIAVGSLIALGMATGFRVSLGWVVLPVVGWLVGLGLAPAHFLRSKMEASERRRPVRRELFRFGRWLAIAGIAGAIFVNMDSILVARYMDLRHVALYGAAFNLSLLVIMLTSAIATVVLPVVSRVSGQAALWRFFRKSILLGILAALILAPLALLGGRFVSLVYGGDYAPATHAFQVLYLGTLLAFIYSTAGLVFFALDRPALVAGQNIAQFLVSFVAYLLLIPKVGIMGGAIGTFAGHAVAVIFVLVAGSRVVRPQ